MAMTWSLPTWLIVAGAFFALVPWMIDVSFSRSLAAQRLGPAQPRYRSREGRWPTFIALQVVNTALFGLCIWAGTQLQQAGIGQLRTDPIGAFDLLLMPFEVLLVLVVFDAQFYWVHRAAHHWPWLFRRLHREHHHDRHPDAWTALCQHPLDIFLATTSPMAWAVVLPIHEGSWWLALLFANYINLAGHSGYEATRFWPGILVPNGWAAMLDPRRRGIARWFNAVTHHQLHHERVTCNYSLYFTHWDHWMRTLDPDTDARYRQAAGLPSPTSSG